MKPRIRKKDTTKNGVSRYILEYVEDNEFKTFALNPRKMLDSPNFRKFMEGEDE